MGPPNYQTEFDYSLMERINSNFWWRMGWVDGEEEEGGVEIQDAESGRCL